MNSPQHTVKKRDALSPPKHVRDQKISSGSDDEGLSEGSASKTSLSPGKFAGVDPDHQHKSRQNVSTVGNQQQQLGREHEKTKQRKVREPVNEEGSHFGQSDALRGAVSKVQELDEVYLQSALQESDLVQQIKGFRQSVVATGKHQKPSGRVRPPLALSISVGSLQAKNPELSAQGTEAATLSYSVQCSSFGQSVETEVNKPDAEGNVQWDAVLKIPLDQPFKNVRKEGKLHVTVRVFGRNNRNHYQPINVITVDEVPLSCLTLGKSSSQAWDLQVKTSENEKQPKDFTLTLGLKLEAGLRPEVDLFFGTREVALRYVDTMLGVVGKTIGHPITRSLVPVSAIALVSATPVLGLLALLTLPLWIGVVSLLILVGWPVLFAVLVALFLATLVTAGGIVLLAAVSKPGRSKLFNLSSPLREGWQTSLIGQQILYDTGPLLSTSQGINMDLPLFGTGLNYQSPAIKLALSLVIDFLGNCSFVIPGLGELADMVWAPVSSYALKSLYGDTVPGCQYVGLVEELLPFTDIIPTATLSWLQERRVLRKSQDKSNPALGDAQRSAKSK